MNNLLQLLFGPDVAGVSTFAFAAVSGSRVEASIAPVNNSVKLRNITDFYHITISQGNTQQGSALNNFKNSIP